MISSWKSMEFLVALLGLQAIVYATVFLDVPVARQVVGFLYFTFVPGFVILKLTRSAELDWLETILFSVGLSVAFLLVAGLFIDEVFSLAGASQPISLIPLMLVLNGLILAGGVLGRSTYRGLKQWKSDSLRPYVIMLPYACLLVLSVLGTFWVNVYGDNRILLILVIAIVSLFIVSVASKKILPPKFYPFAIAMIAISLLYQHSLISKYIVAFGSDVPLETFVFGSTAANAKWVSVPPTSWGELYGRLNAMLSITILPTIYSKLLNVDAAQIFKLLFPLILSFVPLGLYQVWQKHIGRKYAFISAFLFMAQSTFFSEMLGLNRQIIGELFLVLLILVIMNNRLRPTKKTMFFVIFSFGLVTSHYALAEIFLFFILFALLALFALKRPSRNLTVSMVFFYFVVMFAWYIYTSGGTVFESFLGFGNSVYSQLGEFLNPASRGEIVLRGLGMESAPSIWNAISRAIAYVTQILIAIGFVGSILKRTEVRVSRDYFVFSTEAMALLAALIIVPGLANTLNMNRFYHILLFFLAPLCAVGAEVLIRFLSRKKEHIVATILLLVVLAPYFLFQIGFVYEITGSQSWSLPLSKYRMDGYRLIGHLGYIPEQDVFGAYWLSKHADFQHTQLYADMNSRMRTLLAYGQILSNDVNILSNTTKAEDDGVVYLGELNVVYGIVDSASFLLNSTELFFLNDISKTYSNGGCDVYKAMAELNN